MNSYPQDQNVLSLNDVKVFIFSWGPYTENTRKTFEMLKESNVSVTVIDSHEQSPLSEWVTLGNDGYYGNQVNVMKRYVGDEKVIFLIQADASHEDILSIIKRGLEVYSEHPDVGIYAPHVAYTSPFFNHTHNEQKKITKNLYDVPATDCTFWSLRGELLRDFKNLDIELFKMGYFFDFTITAFARMRGMKVVRDYDFLVKHPKSRGYNTWRAKAEAILYFLKLPWRVKKEILKIVRKKI